MDPKPAAAATEEGSVRELVENCMSSDDFTPMLRMMFASGQPLEAKAAVETLQRSLRAVAADQEKVIHDVCDGNAMDIAQCVAELEYMHSSRDDVVQAIAKGNDALQASSHGLVDSARELAGLLAAQRHLSEAQRAVRVTRALLSQWLAVGELVEGRRLFQALVMLRDVRAGYRALLQAQGNPVPTSGHPGAPSLPSASSSNAGLQGHGAGGMGPSLAPTASSHAAIVATLRAAGKKLTASQKLNLYFESLMAELSSAVEYLAISEFNEWLVSVRSQARALGMRAIRRAATENRLDEDLARERRAVAVGLGAGRAVEDLAAKLAAAPLRRDLTKERATAVPPSLALPPLPEPSQASAADSVESTPTGKSKSKDRRRKGDLDPESDTASALGLGAPGGSVEQAVRDIVERSMALRAAAAGSQGGGAGGGNLPEAVAPVLAGVDMRPLYRCLHIQSELGQVGQFREYYQYQRRLQISADLSPPVNFLEAYQPYLAQVTGFFLVEASVVGLAGGLLVSWPQVTVLWEATAAALKVVLDTALAAVRAAPVMALVKDFVLLACGALTRAGYSTTPVQDVLLASRMQYHELLMAGVAADVAKALQADGLGPHVVASEAALRDVVRLGLPPRLDTDEAASSTPARAPPNPKSFPFPAPFSPSTPALLVATRAFVLDSVAYLRGLFAPWELGPAALQHRDKMIGKVVVEALMGKLATVNKPGMLREVERIAVDAWALLQALPALDDWTAAQARPLWQQGGGADGGTDDRKDGAGMAGQQASGASGVAAALRGVQDAAEAAALRLLGSRVEAQVAAARTAVPWLPPAPLPPGTSQYVDEVLACLRDTFAGQEVLPRSSFLFLCRSVMHTVALSIMKLFSVEGIRSYNLFSIERLAADVARLEDAAAAGPVPNLAQELAQPRQLCQLLLSGKIDEVLIPELRRQKYPALDLATLVLVLDRYKEQAKVGKDRTGFPTKKAVETVAKQLRGQMVMGTVAGPRVLEGI